MIHLRPQFEEPAFTPCIRDVVHNQYSQLAAENLFHPILLCHLCINYRKLFWMLKGGCSRYIFIFQLAHSKSGITGSIMIVISLEEKKLSRENLVQSNRNYKYKEIG